MVAPYTTFTPDLHRFEPKVGGKPVSLTMPKGFAVDTASASPTVDYADNTLAVEAAGYSATIFVMGKK